MATDSVRIELAFEGGQIIGALVAPDTADRVERSLNDGAQGTLQLDTDDGRITIALAQVVYLKRFAREASVGFGI